MVSSVEFELPPWVLEFCLPTRSSKGHPVPVPQSAQSAIRSRHRAHDSLTRLRQRRVRLGDGLAGDQPAPQAMLRRPSAAAPPPPLPPPRENCAPSRSYLKLWVAAGLFHRHFPLSRSCILAVGTAPLPLGRRRCQDGAPTGKLARSWRYGGGENTARCQPAERGSFDEQERRRTLGRERRRRVLARQESGG